MQQRENQADRQKGGEDWHLFLKNVWGCMHSQITERIQEMGAIIKQGVKGGLDVIREMFRVDIGSLMRNLQETQQVSERDIRDVTNDADARLIENNERNNQQENLLKQLSDAIIGFVDTINVCASLKRLGGIFWAMCFARRIKIF